MELGDILIWGGLTIILLRFLVPRVIEHLGFEITKSSKQNSQDRD